MTSFQQLKSSRDKRHRIPSVSAVISTADGPSGTLSQLINVESGPSLPAGVKVRTDGKRGRGLYASTAFRAGAIVLSTKPLQAVLSIPNLQSTCSGCFLTPREIEIQTARRLELSPCSKCETVYYCSEQCRQSDHEDHEEECTILTAIGLRARQSSIPPDVPTESIRALGRICLKRKKERSLKGKEPEWWSSVQSLENHLSQLSESGGFEQLAGLARQLGRYLAYSMPEEVSREDLFASFGFTATGDLLELVSAFQVNSFTLSLPDVSPIGVAISPTVALANHSCDPNAVVVFPNGGRKMQIIAIRDVSEGEEILTSYIDVAMPGEKRHSELQATYRFTCQCVLCERDLRIREKEYRGSEIDQRASVWHRACKRKSKGKSSLPLGWQDQDLLHLRCDRCKEPFELQVSDLLVPYQRAETLLEADAKGRDDLTQNSFLFQLIPALHAILTPSSFPLLALLRLQLLRVRPSTPNELAYLDKLYSIVVAGSTQVYPAHHPVLAILHAEWGQVLTQTFDGEDQALISGRMIKSVETLRKAYALCQVAFGKEGGIEGKKVADVLRGVEAELQMARSMAR